MNIKVLLTLLAGMLTMAAAPIADACTGITLRAKDGAVVFGRSMEWGTFDLKSRVIIFPRGQKFAGHTPDHKSGLVWEAQHGFVGLDAPAMGEGLVVDGMNEHGLCVNGFYHPGFAEYEAYDPAKANRSIGPGNVIPYLLSTCATVNEVKAALAKVDVTPVIAPSLGIAPPGHWIVTEPSGKSIVIEYLKGELALFDAPLGVITNAPSYDWHITNLRNYLNLSPVALPSKRIEEMDFAPLGGGSGMIGLPGDNTPPSRFVRAVAASQTARSTSTGKRPSTRYSASWTISTYRSVLPRAMAKYRTMTCAVQPFGRLPGIRKIGRCFTTRSTTGGFAKLILARLISLPCASKSSFRSTK